MASPPKPWEQAGASTSVLSQSLLNTSSPGQQQNFPMTDNTSTNAPNLPERPPTLAQHQNNLAAGYSRMGASTGYSSPYSSPYSRFGGYGGYGSGMYGAPGGYGGYGGYGNMYGGGMFGGGMPGMMGQDPNNPNSLTNSFNQSTAATFQILEGVVHAFGGFAQMLESTYMATHSSFFAMIAVAEQFGNLRDTLGSVLGIFAVLRWIRTLFAKVTGRPLPSDAKSLTPANFANFEGRKASPSGAPAGPPRASRKPLVFFLLAAFGLPYLMSKFIRALAANHEEEQKRMAAANGHLLPDGRIDVSKLEYCRAKFDYNPPTANAGEDLAIRKGELVAVLRKTDPFGTPVDWWHCRTRDGKMGYLPSTYLEKLDINPQQLLQKGQNKGLPAIKATESDSSRANSLTSSGVTVETIPGPPTPVPADASPLGDLKGLGVAPTNPVIKS